MGNDTLFGVKMSKININNPSHARFIADCAAAYFTLPLMRVQNFKKTVTRAGGAPLPAPIRHIQNFMTTSEKVNSVTRAVKKKLSFNQDKAVQNFMDGMKAHEKRTGQVQFSTALTDYPDFLVDLMQTLETSTFYDETYQQFYKPIPVDGDGYDVMLKEYDMSFKETPPGATVKYGGSNGTKYRVFLNWYSGGHGVDRRLIIAKNFYQVAEDAAELRTAAFYKKAQIAYALIEAVPAGRDILYQNPYPNNLATNVDTYPWNRIAMTIKEGIEQLIADNIEGENWKKNVTPQGLNTTFHILYPYQLSSNMIGAINYKFKDQQPGNPTSIMDYNIMTHSTTMLTDPTKFYIIIPNGQMTTASLLDYTTFTEFNQTTFMDSTAAWMSYDFNNGDTEQVVRCYTA